MALAIFMSYENIVLTKVIVEIWGQCDSATLESGREESSYKMRHIVNKIQCYYYQGKMAKTTKLL